eukprot:UN15203
MLGKVPRLTFVFRVPVIHLEHINHGRSKGRSLFNHMGKKR